MPKPALYLALAIAAVHFGASIVVFLWSYVATAAAFDGRALSWASRNLARPLFEALWFPLGTVMAQHLSSGMWLYLGVLANSLCWAAAFLGVRFLARKWHGRAPKPAVFVAGALCGALSWLAAWLVSGTFEPNDSSGGLLVNQVVLSAPAVVLAWRCRVSASLLFLTGAYGGMNAYAYGFGGSEHRAWAGLGAVTSLLLFLVPVVFMLGTVAVRRLRQWWPLAGLSKARAWEE